MKTLHYINALLWFLNAVLWLGWAHSPFMALASFAAAIGAMVIGRRTDRWDYR